MGKLQRSPASTKDNDMNTTIHVEGMTCPHCVASVKSTVESMTGVDLATPDLDTGMVSISGDGFDVSALRAAIEQSGYKVLDD